MLRKALGWILLVGLLGGCTPPDEHHHCGRKVAEFQPGQEPQTARTPYAATYALYHRPDPLNDPPAEESAHDHEPSQVAMRDLGRRELIGFMRGTNGQLFAVAGEEKIPLPMGRYCWRIVPNSKTE